MRDFRAEIKRFTRDNARIASLNDHRSSSNDPSSMQKKKKNRYEYERFFSFLKLSKELYSTFDRFIKNS